jgi:hypothetical protein
MTTLEFTNQLLQFQDKLNYFAISLTSDKDDADDLMQETYFKALSNRDKYSEQTNLKAWVYTIMKKTPSLIITEGISNPALRLTALMIHISWDTSKDKYIVQQILNFLKKKL